jgi:hypothetical protein
MELDPYQTAPRYLNQAKNSLYKTEVFTNSVLCAMFAILGIMTMGLLRLN